MKDRNAMLSAMKKEIALRKDYLAPLNPRQWEEERPLIETLYFGGGTPSVLSIDELAGLMETVLRYYTLVPHAEITLEANPDDLCKDYLEALFHIGFNRLSVGIQSFFDDDLQWMNRRHCAREAIQSVEAARKAGFYNINIDLMYGLPTMTPARWKENLKQALAIDAPHLSAYHLTIEPRTVFDRRQAKGETFAVPEEDSAEQFNILLDTMENAGYEHYEISNFARSGFRSRHNTAYWQQRPYVGIGPAAHSFDGQSRQWNIGNNSAYIAALEGDSAWFEREELTPAEQYNDYILVSLRTAWGVDAGYIHAHFGNVFANEFLRQSAAYLQNGFLRKQADVFTLTRKGKMIADRIASDLFWVAV
jgi:oxygen-independent coproporphyrinogen-3 oxidase